MSAVPPFEGSRPNVVGHAAGIVGESAPMRDMYRMLERVRTSHATILVTGENGTGKELVARAIHNESPRRTKRFVATNCSAFNDNLLESELFGHKRGAFTGAVSDKPGLFEIADGGTFFMDEVGDMSQALQVKLLRVLQEGTFMSVGASEQKHVDVRIIAATNRDLSAMVREGTFREDLFYRLHVVAIHVPPLRKRLDDIPLLVKHFLGRLEKRDGKKKSLTASVMQHLHDHSWPGNVRELENEIERLWVLSGDDAVIDETHMSDPVRRSMPPPPPAPFENMPSTQRLPEAVEALERHMITESLKRTRGNKTRTALELGISRRNLIRKVQAYNLVPWNAKGDEDP
ncbi:MAG: sigma 54-interacting transcriptional regulator [Sandaracinaceae bacterium]|jgi:two-component system response regulator HupR/HoxA|nr:sigma 54-interacting transcriptional regulator [Sandaracinaceae bacterium]